MFCKQGESVDGTRLICSACDQVSMLYAGKPLCPAAVNMDCSDAFRAGVLMVWPDSRACCTKLVCYPVLLMDGYLCCPTQVPSRAGLTSITRSYVENT